MMFSSGYGIQKQDRSANIGMRFAGRYGDEATLFGLASQLEKGSRGLNAFPLSVPGLINRDTGIAGSSTPFWPIRHALM